MFKKLKDKLAEEVKSSPQRIQQIAQAAQAAVTSASSSISDITNSDLFSIGDNDIQQIRSIKPQTMSHHETFQDVPLVQASGLQTSTDDFGASHDTDNQRQRRLSNSSLASDVSFRLPNYESPSMYHLQSDLEVSASEAEERGFVSTESLDRVTKEQVYAAYRRTQERYTKYRTQYASLAHHYKLLERENAKARSVLVETQDKALRRISELREQCALEQSAKAHLEKALRVDIEEKNLKIDALTTKISLLQNNGQITKNDNKDDNANKNQIESESETQLINFATDDENKQRNENSEITTLNNKIEKMEQLINKYKESFKTTKEKNSQMTTEMQKLSIELENKNKEIELLNMTAAQLAEANEHIQNLMMANEELENKIKSYDFSKSKAISTLELDLEKAKEKITNLQTQINTFSKKEEEYAISLAENKLSIHKELESKEAEIKSLKECLSAAKKELQSVSIIVNDYKNNISQLEEERTKLSNDINELDIIKIKNADLETQIQLLKQKVNALELSKSKADEEFKCLQLQMKQETAEKLAIIDRNVYLENRIAQLTEENAKKSTQISKLDNELHLLKQENEKFSNTPDESEINEMQEELNAWKQKYITLESEIQEERDELVKLQSEIEKLLTNHELIQTQNSNLNISLTELKTQNAIFHQQLSNFNNIKTAIVKLANDVKILQNDMRQSSNEAKNFSNEINLMIPALQQKVQLYIKFADLYEISQNKYKNLQKDYENLQIDFNSSKANQEMLVKNLHLVQTENDRLQSKIQEYQNLQKDYAETQHQLKQITSTQEVTIKEIQKIQNENERLNYQLQGYEILQNKHELLQKEIETITEKHLDLTKQFTVLQEENNTVKLKLDENKDVQKHFEILQKELESIERKYEKTLNEKEILFKENESIKLQLQNSQSVPEQNILLEKDELKETNKFNEYEEIINKLRQETAEKEIYIVKLEQRIESMSQENIALKNQSDNITKNVKNLQFEIEEVRKAHAEIENEKDRLNLIIEQLGKNQQECNVPEKYNKYTQIDEQEVSKTHEDELIFQNITTLQRSKGLESAANLKYDMESLLSEIKLLKSQNNDFENEIIALKDINNQLSNKVMAQYVDPLDNGLCTDKYNNLNNECEMLREENRRLQSDVEGLQTYLTKISKENTILNDRLREVIASSELTTDKNEINLSDITKLQLDVQTEKHRIEDLLRENSLLLEENLELKDQIRTQNDISTTNHHGNNIELISLREKYNELLVAKKNLEERLNSLEQINQSVNGNVQQMQDGNQKLRLANEKLERRLDEALVSLRHLHSLQENTELEYLRNILYEYLTGSGTHSVTLAKVLSAVVKFDDRQTQLVLQKEKERQGLLRQLGLL